MSVVANTFTTFDAIGNHEDLAEVIYDISPTDTPFLALCETVSATSTLHEWQTETLAAAGPNAQIQGDEIAFQPVQPTRRVGNRTQISRKEAIVSATQNVVNAAGRQREIVHQLLKKSKELKRDMEFVLTGNQTPVMGSGALAQQLRPLCGWYETNASRGTGGTSGTATGEAGDGETRPLTEALLKPVLQRVWTAGGEPSVVMVGPYNKTVVSGFTGNATRFDSSEDKKLVATIDVYESDFGALRVVPNRFQRERDCHVLSADLWGIAYLRRPETVALAKTGDHEKAMIVTEYTLEARNEAGSGIVADLEAA
ncbi:MAG: DUF5309 domain-containing protein [Alphaproteobacteria bacterium]|nr:DUF5309 domain-containing protein [Alphaproteobacteria bacterium]